MLWLWLACTSEDSNKTEEPEKLDYCLERGDLLPQKYRPHRFRSVFEQTEFHGEDVRNTHREVLSIDWVDCDHWQATHMVDDDVVMQVIIMDSTCWEQALDSLSSVQMENPIVFNCVACGISGIL